MSTATQNRRRCPSCSASVPSGVGVCPQCGSPLFVGQPDGHWGVVIEPLPSLSARREVSQWLDAHLQVDNPQKLSEALGKGTVYVGGNLNRASAQTLTAALTDLRAKAKLVDEAPKHSASVLKVFFHPLALIFMAIGVAVAIFLPIIGIVPAIILYAMTLGALWMRQKRGSVPTAASAPMEYSTFDGWEDIQGELPGLFERLPIRAREDLGRLTTTVAEIQAELASESMVAFAAGLTDERLAATVQKLLARGVAAARAIDAGHKGTAPDTLKQLADASEAAWARLQELDAQVGSTSQANEALAELEEAIEQAEVVVAQVAVTHAH